MDPPSPKEIDRAAELVADHGLRTPSIRSERLSSELGCRTVLKLESLAPVGSFKARGAVARLAAVPEADRDRGVVTASTGNHGIAVAWAARRFGMDATVVVPEGTGKLRRSRMAGEGAEVVVEGDDWNASCRVARRIAGETGAVAVQDGDDPAIMAGAGTLAREIVDDHPDVDAIVVPVGGGNLAAGVALAVRDRDVDVVGVQSEAAPGVVRSLEQDRIVEAPPRTVAAGIATAGPLELAFDVIRDHVRDVLLVPEEALLAEVGRLLLDHGIVAEPAAAAPSLAVRTHPDRFADGTVALVVTGSTVEPATLRDAVDSYRPSM